MVEDDDDALALELELELVELRCWLLLFRIATGGLLLLPRLVFRYGGRPERDLRRRNDMRID